MAERKTRDGTVQHQGLGAGPVATRQEREPTACAESGLAATGVAGKSHLSFMGFSTMFLLQKDMVGTLAFS